MGRRVGYRGYGGQKTEGGVISDWFDSRLSMLDACIL